MRNFILWTLSILLGFEPALWAQGQAEQQAQVKAFIEKNQIAKRSVSIRELYDKNASLLSPTERSTLKKFVETYGNQKLPKMDVTKVKARDGEENYQLQFAQKGQSITLEIINKGEVFARLNGKILSMADMQSIEGLMIKAGVSVAEAKKNFARAPASVSDKALNINQLKKLSKSEQSLYFKQLRQLLESMEAVEHSMQKKKPTSSLETFNRFEVIARWLQGEPAFAATPTSCVAAGWPARTGLNDSKALKCGTDGKGVAEAYRKRPNGDLCPPTQFVCNPSIYGSYGGNGLCVNAGPTSTKECNSAVVEGKDIPDLSKAEDGSIAAAMEAAEEVMAICSSFEDDSSSSDSSDAPAKQSAKKKAAKKGKGKKSKGGAKPDYSGLTNDQRNTCGAFKERYDQINSWKCTNPEFAGSHPNICPAQKGETPPPAPTPTPAPPAPPTGKMRSCSELPNDLAPAGTKCDGGSDYPVEGPDEISKCLDGVRILPIIRCDCTPGMLTAKFRCTHPNGDEHGGGKAEAAAKKKGPNWLLIGGVAFGGLLLYHWLNKKSQKEYYKTIDPLPQQPPVPPPVPVPAPEPTITEPAPRGVG